MIADQYAALLLAARAVFPGEFRAGNMLNEIAGLAIKQPGHAELAAAIEALVRKPDVFRLGKLLARMRGKPYGDLRLDGEYNKHHKAWNYWIVPANTPPQPTPAEALKNAEWDLELAEEMQEAIPLHQMSASEFGRFIDTAPKVGRPPDVLKSAQKRADKNVAAAQREVTRATVDADPELQQALKDIARQKAAEVKEKERQQREKEAKENGGPDFIPMRDMADLLRVDDRWVYTATGEVYREVFDSGTGGSQYLRGFEKGRPRNEQMSFMNPHMTAREQQEFANRPPGEFVESTRMVRGSDGKMVSESFLDWIPFSGLAAAQLSAYESVRLAGGSGGGFVNTTPRESAQAAWHRKACLIMGCNPDTLC